MRKPRNQKPRAEHEGDQKPLSIRSASVTSRVRDPYSDEQKQQLSSCADVAQKVETLCVWMAKGWYTPGSDAAVARVWGCAPDTVRGIAAEARRMLARELLSKSRDELLAELLARIAYLGQDALDRREEVVTVKGDVVEVRRPDHRTALRAAEATGELLGLKIQRHQHSITASELTTEQILEQLRQHGVRVEMPVLTTGEEVAEPGTAQEEKQ